MPLPPPGTFRLYPFAEPPLPPGRYTLSAEVTGLPGPVEPLPAVVDVVAPRYSLPPDQILGTFPPAGARGAFTARLPQMVVRRRTLLWERSPARAPGDSPVPWVALVLLAEGEGELHPDLPVEECVTPGVDLGTERDVPRGACIEVPQRVVDAVFPARGDLHLLAHVREVDLADTELAMGDDDGWMAVVLANRLPQADTRYLACLVSLEGQLDALPVDPPMQLDYDRRLRVADLGTAAHHLLGSASSLDAAVMGLGGASGGAAPAAAIGTGGPLAPPSHVSAVEPAAAAGPVHGTVVRAATGAAAHTGAGWAESVAGVAGYGPAGHGGMASGAAARHALADGFAHSAALLREPTLRFPALAYWSFSCQDGGDFRYLAGHVTSRLLGHLADPDVPETPDGDPVPQGSPPPAPSEVEPPAVRPLPLVAETGHLALEAVSRRGDATRAWFRGPLVPAPVERAAPRPDGDLRPPLAHHADQLRRVVPDGREDLGYAAAFEIGRLLALSQPGVVAALGRWRQEAFGAARASGAVAHALADASPDLKALAEAPDPFTDDTPERLRVGGAGRRAVRALFQLLGEDPGAIAPSRPLADPGAAASAAVHAGGDAALAVGLALEDALPAAEGAQAPLQAELLAEAPARVAGRRDLAADTAALRRVLEAEAGRLADGAARVPQRSAEAPKGGGE